MVRCLFQHRERLLDHRVDLRHILFHVALRDLEERPLRLLHQVVHIYRFVERLVLDGRREANQLTSQVFLGDNAGMKLQVRRTGHLAGQLRDVGGTSYFIQGSHPLELFRDRDHIHRLLPHIKITHSREDQLMRPLIKALRLQDVAHDRISVLLQQERTQHRLLQFPGLRLQTPHLWHHLYRRPLSSPSGVSNLFCHRPYCFEPQKYKMFLW